jgi:tetratricopeptide (TPR) repeat protein
MDTLQQLYSPTKAAAALDIIRRAKECELVYDLENEGNVLREIWQDFSAHPDLTHYPREITAELYLTCGYFLTAYGRAKGVKTYKKRGRNYLCRSIKLFQRCGVEDKVAEARCHLALHYHYEGKDRSAEEILRDAEKCFDGNDLHSAYLKIQVNLLIVYYWTHQYDAALEIIARITPSIVYLDNPALLMFFHGNAGGVHRKRGDMKLAAFHLKEALRFAKRIENERQVGIAYNNLASFCAEIHNFKCAEKFINDALDIFTRFGDKGLTANVLDSKANILREQGRLVEALPVIDQAIGIFRAADNLIELAEAYWTKIQILVGEHRHAEARRVFQSLEADTATNIGEDAVKDYAARLERILRPAVEIHCLDSPDPGIEHLTHDGKLFFEGEKITEKVYLFSVPAHKSRCGFDVVVCVSPRAQSDLRVIKYEGQYLAGNLSFDSLGVFVFDGMMPLERSKIFLVGGIIGYCRADEFADECVNFKAV